MQELAGKTKSISFHFPDGSTKTITKKEGENEIHSFLTLIQKRGFKSAVIIEARSRGKNIIPRKVSINFQ